MYKGFKFRMYPNMEQKKIIDKTLWCNRYVYNYYLKRMICDGYINVYNNINDLTNNLIYKSRFLQEMDINILKKTLYILDDSCKKNINNFSNVIKFKSRYKRCSYSITNSNNIMVDLINKKLKLPLLDWTIIKGYRNLTGINGAIKSVTISKEGNNKYYVSILYNVFNKIPVVKHATIVGIDLGIKTQLSLSNGITYSNNKYIFKYEKRIKRKQKSLSRKIKGSKNYYKCRLELNTLYIKLFNSRKYYTHNVSKKIILDNDIIVCEKLNINNMVKNANNSLSKYIYDATFSELIRQFNYKSVIYGKKFFQIESFYPSSQICSKCNTKNELYRNLLLREYRCNKCGLIIDRDLNASINILSLGLLLYMKDLTKT